MIGSFLALVGQIYQTGADPWQLFAIWTALIIPLVIVSKSAMLWTTCQFLLNLSLFLFFSHRFTLFGFVFNEISNVMIMLVINTSILVLFELFYQNYFKYKLQNRYSAQLAALAVIFGVTLLGMNSIIDNHSNNGIYLLVYMLWMPGIYYIYRNKIKDLLILSAWVMSLIVFVTTFLIKAIGDF